MRRLSSISIRRKRITIRKKIATILLSNSFPISVLFPPAKDNRLEWTSLSLWIESTIIRTLFQSGNTWDTNGYVRKGVVGWWLLTTPLVTFVPILARFEIRPIVSNFNRRMEKRQRAERGIVGGGDGEARYRRGKTGEREGGSRYRAILTRHPFALVARYLEV